VTAPRRPQPASPIQPSAARIIEPPAAEVKPAIYVRAVRGMGRGVFAGRRFRTGEVIEVCPVIPIPRRQTRKCVGELLDRYIFQWPRPGYPAAVVLGYGSLYNHAPDPNAVFVPRPGTDAMVFRAARPIAVGEQILVNYEWPARDYHFPLPAREAANDRRLPDAARRADPPVLPPGRGRLGRRRVGRRVRTS